MKNQTLVSNPLYVNGQAGSMHKNIADSEQADPANAANKDLESFSYSVSHDLRSSIRSINGFAKMLAEDKAQSLDEEGKEYLQVIRESALRMDKLIDDLMRLTKYNAKPLIKEKVNVNEVIARIVKAMAYKGEMTIGNMKTAFADPDLLTQLWANLISNAIKFSSGKSNPVIEIGTVKVQSETVYYIKDNGAGFDMKYAGKLFAIFQRMHNEREFPGAGVGLAIVHRIVNRHGGKIWAEAAVDQGAIFYFTLPSN